uniref:Cyclin-dependent kinase inhibitor domain-containing protein n=1 Tax=Ciona savignyi TaxID=51511 RepID=H2YR41_CIOSA
MADRKPPTQQLQKVRGVGSARRNLFGRDDKTSDALEKETEELDAKQQKRFLETWNFDPKNGKPLDGPYEWDTGTALHERTRLLHVPAPHSGGVERTDGGNTEVNNISSETSQSSRDGESSSTMSDRPTITSDPQENQTKRRKLSSTEPADDITPSTQKDPRL